MLHRCCCFYRTWDTAWQRHHFAPWSFKQLLPFLHPAPQVTFQADLLVEGPEADRRLAKFSPKLVGRGAAVTVGHMAVSALPHDFL